MKLVKGQAEEEVDEGCWGRYEATCKNMIGDREGWRERIRVVDPTCVGRRQRKRRRKLILKTDFLPGLPNFQTVRSLYM